MKNVDIDKIKQMDSASKQKHIERLRATPDVCQQCVDDDLLHAVRDVDAICYHCKKAFCAKHLIMHLEEVHCVEVNHLYLDLEETR